MDKNIVEVKEVNRKDVYNIMLLFESFEVKEVDEGDNFEDITDELFKIVDEDLMDNEMICHTPFNYEETMTAFEAMDDKMDLRKNKGKV
jgi:hypothetical protein